MTLRELIDFVKTLRPGVPFSDSIFITWINELEAEIQSNVFLLDISSMVFHEAADEAVLADDAHGKVYWMYLCAMIDLANGEYSRYQDDVTIYNGLMSDYRVWYAERYDPASGRAEISGYYISAYSLAVKHGFTGSEEDWLRYISANAEAALNAQQAAEAAQKKAETAQKGSEDAAGAALLHKSSAEAAKEASETARRGAEAARTGAETAQVASEGAREGAENALALAGEARTGAESARDTALDARDGAVAARNAAQEARDAALRAEADAETAEAGAVDARAGAEAAERAALVAQEAAEKARGLAEAARTGAETAQEGAEAAELAAVSAGEAAQAAKGLAELARDNAKAAETGAKLAQGSAETARTGAETAQTAAEKAKEAAESAQAGAVSAKTAAETARESAQAAQSGAVAAKEAAETARTGAEAARDSAEASKTAAEASETAAQAAKTAAQAAQSAAEGSALQAEAWARGTEGGVPVASGHPAYQNNSKYYMEQAAAIVGGDYPTRAEAQGYAEEAEARAKAYADDQISAHDGTSGAHENLTPAFSEAASRANITSGETLRVMLGKIRKFFSDLKAVAFTGAYSDLSGRPTLGALAAKSTAAKGDLAADVQASLGKADTALQSFTETDPTVSAWAKAAAKPSYTKVEVGLGNVDNTSDANKPVSTAVQTELNGKAGKASVISVTLTAAGWSGAGPYTQTVSVAGLSATGNGTLGLAQTATAEQREAARDGMISVTGQAAGSITVTADGDKPAVDIPCVVTILG